MSCSLTQTRVKFGEFSHARLLITKLKKRDWDRFGEDSAEKMVDWAEDNLENKDAGILDCALSSFTPWTFLSPPD